MRSSKCLKIDSLFYFKVGQFLFYLKHRNKDMNTNGRKKNDNLFYVEINSNFVVSKIN